jgi:hypothetical protein
MENLLAQAEKFHDQHVDINDPLMHKNFMIMGLKEVEEKVKQPEESKEEQWLLAKALKIERIKQRVQNDALKQINNKGKSVGELALQFIGINKIAYDLMQDNPMSGYMEKVIFTRVLGSDEIEDG